jgi:hypothetical protein
MLIASSGTVTLSPSGLFPPLLSPPDRSPREEALTTPASPPLSKTSSFVILFREKLTCFYFVTLPSACFPSAISETPWRLLLKPKDRKNHDAEAARNGRRPTVKAANTFRPISRPEFPQSGDVQPGQFGHRAWPHAYPGIAHVIGLPPATVSRSSRGRETR